MMNEEIKEITKICIKCDEDKPLSEFYKIKSGKYGVTAICKECTRQSRRSQTIKRRAPLNGSRQCGICKTFKPINEFHPSNKFKDGFSDICALCMGIKMDATKSAIKANKKSYEPLIVGDKKCTTCGNIKHITKFHKNKRSSDGRSAVCADCACAVTRQWNSERPGYSRIYMATAPQHVLENQKMRCLEYRKSHREELCTMEKLRYASKREEIRAQRKAKYDKEHDYIVIQRRAKYNSDQEWKDAENARRRQRRSENIEFERARQIKWTRSHPDSVKASHQKRRAAKAGIPGSHTLKEWMDLCDLFDNRCVRCGDDDKLLTLDHIIPITWQGSSDWIENCQPLCISCNAGKRNLHATDYRLTPFTFSGVIYSKKKLKSNQVKYKITDFSIPMEFIKMRASY